MKSLLPLAALVAIPVCALAQPTQTAATFWPKGASSVMNQPIDVGTHGVVFMRRNASGQAEVHKTKADVMVIQSGTATFVTGGTVVNPRETAPNEILGTEIRDGVRTAVGPGDVINVPVAVPHQFILAPGTEVTYFVVKITKP